MLDSLLHLTLIKGVGPATINRIMKAVAGHTSEMLYTLRESDVVDLCGVNPTIAAKVVQGLADKKVLERELTLADKHRISLISIYDEEYPTLLKEIYLPPPILYIRGTLQKSAKALAVVGSRKAHSYAEQALDMVLPLLIENNWIIVSGGAYGTDTFAHSITVDSGGTTYVVLGSGLLKLYPQENNQLFEDVVHAGGALISSFALEHEPLPGNFPARNRIIAGLSQGCLIVQAAQKVVRA